MTLPHHPQRRTATVIGIALVISGYFLSSISDVAVKYMSGGYSASQVVFFTALFSLLPMVAAVMAGGGPVILATARPGLHLLRGTIGFIGYMCGYYAIGHMPLADFYAMVFTAPLFITAFSALIAGEWVCRQRWLAVGGGFIGVLVMVRPGSGDVGLGTLAVLAGSVCYACSVLLVRRMGEREQAAAFGFYGALVMVGGAGLFLSSPTLPSRPDLVLFAVSGIGMGTALLCIFAAFGRAPAAALAPFQYSQMIWGVLAGFFLFGDSPNWAVACGGALVIGSGLYILYRETRSQPA